jgi:hypothetical protein
MRLQYVFYAPQITTQLIVSEYDPLMAMKVFPDNHYFLNQHTNVVAN